MLFKPFCTRKSLGAKPAVGDVAYRVFRNPPYYGRLRQLGFHSLDHCSFLIYACNIFNGDLNLGPRLRQRGLAYEVVRAAVVVVVVV